MLQLCNPVEGGMGTALKTPLLSGAAAIPPPAHRGKQRRCPAVSAEHPNTPQHLPTASPGKTRAQARKVEGNFTPCLVGAQSEQSCVSPVTDATRTLTGR